jgi:hypothetical protein
MQPINESGHTFLRIYHRTTSEYRKSMPLLRILLHAHIPLLQIFKLPLASAPKVLRKMVLEEFLLEPIPRYGLARVSLLETHLL